ncbi:MAG: 8-oxo-dGTP diphosphatase [Lachnospiraceae bacterium]|nr:8-oxo-dGTP diphosphatase [Lachnospiraceae bacterium]
MSKSPLTTLCYIEKENQYLMMHRIKKKDDGNHDKWIGIGGHFEFGESPEECLLREVQEETGLTLTRWRFRGLVTFVSGDWEEYMCLYTADEYAGEMTECSEGQLVWVDKTQIPALNIWEGDKIFLQLLAQEHPFFSLKLVYEGDQLVEAKLDGIPMDLTQPLQ